MNKNFDLEQINFKILYLKYREFILPAVIIIVSFLLLLFFIVPQFSSFLQNRKAENDLREKVKILRENLNFALGLNDSDLNTELILLNNSLPVEKDFVSIMNTLSTASNKAGISLGDYGFIVGDLSTQSAQIKTTSFIQIDLNVRGNLQSSKLFIEELSKMLPLSESVSLKSDGSTSIVTVYFYHKPFSPVSFDNSVPITSLTNKELETLNRINSLKNTTLEVPISENLSTESSSLTQ